MKRFHLGRARPPAMEAPREPQVEASWRESAMAIAGLWLLVDSSLRVLEMSSEATALFGAVALPAGFVNVTRSAAGEALARQAVAGDPGPWDFDATHFRRSLRMRGADLAPHGTLLLFEDITELLRLEGMRADFVANLAHELRTPVASLSLAAETLTTDLPAHEQRRFIGRIAEETRYIEGLLRSISELAVLESEVNLNVTTFVLRDVVDETWRRVSDRQGPGLLDNRVSGELLVRADRVRVAEVLQNLLENAHRFSPEGSPVAVEATAGSAEVEVRVTDQGPGIPAHELPRVFERFYKVDRARTRRGDGSGLGLAIAKHLVSAHAGRIWAAAAPSGGTVISFTIPVGTPGSPPAGDDPEGRDEV